MRVGQIQVELLDVEQMNGRIDGCFLGILSPSFCLDMRGALRSFCLYSFRVKRNLTSYTGEDMDIASVEACINAGEYLLRHVRGWLAENHPKLVK